MSEPSQARVVASLNQARLDERGAAHAPRRAERRMLFADGLRGIAAMWVVLFHLAEGSHVGALRAALPRWLDTCLFAWGHGGVGIFFVLSGFVMALTVERASMDGPDSGRFVLRRLVRLCPPYWVAIALYAAMTLAKGGAVGAGQLLANALFLQGMAGVDNINIVFWTLCIEVQFYVAFAAMTWASDRLFPVSGRSGPRVMIALLALAWPLGLLTSPMWRGGFLPFWVFFMAGVVAFESSRGQGTMRAVAGAFGALLLGIGCQGADMFSGVAGLTCLALVASRLGDGMQTWLSARPLQVLGAVSYSLYLKRPDAIGALTRVAAHDVDAEVRRIAVGAMGYAAAASDVSIHPALSRALADPVWQVREEAAATFAKTQSAVGIPDLVNAMGDAYWQVRVKAARSLGKLKAGAGVDALAEASMHEISNLRKEAVIALGEVGDPRGIVPLERALGDGDPDVRKLAKLALTSIRMAAGSKGGTP